LISISGIGLGLLAGLQKDQFALVLTDKTLINGLKDGRDYAFGSNFEVTVGKSTSDDEYQRSSRENFGGRTYLYAKRNGAYIAAALEAAVISVRKKSNAALYPHLTVDEIISGNRAGTPEALLPLVNAIQYRSNIL
jgi:lipid-binding SYLF domain-containing protein